MFKMLAVIHTCRLVSFLNEVELVVCKFVSEPECIRVRPSLRQKSKIDSDSQLLFRSENVCVVN